MHAHGTLSLVPSLPPTFLMLQVPYAESLARASVLKGRQEWSAARPVLQQLGEAAGELSSCVWGWDGGRGGALP